MSLWITNLLLLRYNDISLPSSLSQLVLLHQITHAIVEEIE